MTEELLKEMEIFDYLNECLHQGETRVVFQKADGSKRTMNCTLVPSYYPNYVFNASGDTDGVPSSVVRVWDIDKEAWRSISRGSIEEVELTKYVPVKEDIG